MPNISGALDARGLKMAIVFSKFNSAIGERLLTGAQTAFTQLGGDESQLTVYQVPGAFEVPGVAQRLARSGELDAIVCLGVIIQGSTPHFEHVAGNVSSAIMRLAQEGWLPVIFGVLTTHDVEQAMDRAGVKLGNKGFEAMMSAVEMVQLYRQIP